MKRILSVALVLGFLLTGFAGAVAAEDKYPSRPIELVIPFGAGGTADLGARCYTDDLTKLLGVPVTPVNRPGGTGIQGVTYVINGKKDGYTILGTTDTPLMIMPVISKEVAYDPLKDIVPIARFAHPPNAIVVNANSPFKTLQELIDYARQNPGKLKNGATGIGTEAQFNLVVICSKAKIKIVTIPFNSGGAATAALLGGHVDVISTSLASLGQQIQAGKLRPLSVSSKVAAFPNVPTTTELGFPEAAFEVWTGMFAPAGVPKEVVDVLAGATEKVFKSPEVVKRAVNMGFTMSYMGPEELRKHMEKEVKLVREVAEEAGIAAK